MNTLFDNRWFFRNQGKLLAFSNTLIGRYFLRIHGKHSSVGDNKIIYISPNSITWKKNHKFVTEFRSNEKFARRIYFGLYPVWKTFHEWDMKIANPFMPSWNLGFDTTGDLFPAAGANSPVDGYVGRAGAIDETLATIRAGAGNNSDETPETLSVYIEASATTNQFDNLFRSIVCFDTSSITDGTTINAAVLSVWGSTKSNGLGSPDLHAVASTPAATNALADSDYANVGTTSFGSVAYASFSTVAYNDITLDSNGRNNISATGVSKFGFRNSWDQSGTFGGVWASNANSNLVPFSADKAGTTNDPKLVVTFSFPTGGGNPMFFSSGGIALG